MLIPFLRLHGKSIERSLRAMKFNRKRRKTFLWKIFLHSRCVRFHEKYYSLTHFRCKSRNERQPSILSLFPSRFVADVKNCTKLSNRSSIREIRHSSRLASCTIGLSATATTIEGRSILPSSKYKLQIASRSRSGNLRFSKHTDTVPSLKPVEQRNLTRVLIRYGAQSLMSEHQRQIKHSLVFCVP